MRWRFWRRCHPHDWFPNHPPREYIVTTDVCLHCEAIRVNLPYGFCLTGHPIEQHYDEDGRLVVLNYCAGPR